MSQPERGLSARSLAELALIISRVARTCCDDSGIPSIASLRAFWQSSRLLEQRWTKYLDEWSAAERLDVEALKRISHRIFTSEMLVRTWSTVLAGIDRRRGSDDLLRLGRNAVNSLARVRNGVLARLLRVPDANAMDVMEIDRLRRRCDRWNDLLIGSMFVRSECLEFAFDSERARDFSEESLSTDPAIGPHPAEHFISAGLRLNFIRHLSVEPIEEPEMVCLIKSILSNIPPSALHRDGTFRSLLEQRIASGGQHLERRAVIPIFSHDNKTILQFRKVPKKYHRDE